MKLNWAERWVVNNPLRVLQQRIEIGWFKKVMPLKPGCTLLEVGCGRGAGARLILKAFQPSVLHCMDIDIQMIRKVRKYLSPEELHVARPHTSDLVSLPYKDGSVDAVFDFGALHHVPDWRRALREIARVIKPGGVFYMEELYPALYQNIITKHILVHPREDRFLSGDLQNAITQSNLTLRNSVENKGLGIIGVAVKDPR
jgi:ubiquinone/menaquinone biosynthesis C-methylase UbiE